MVGCLLFKKYLVESHQVRLLLFPSQVGLRGFSLTEISTIGIFAQLIFLERYLKYMAKEYDSNVSGLSI